MVWITQVLNNLQHEYYIKSFRQQLFCIFHNRGLFAQALLRHAPGVKGWLYAKTLPALLGSKCQMISIPTSNIEYCKLFT